MQKKYTVLLIGGDLRQARLANRFAEQSQTEVYAVGLQQDFVTSAVHCLTVPEGREKLQSVDALFLPMPAMADDIFMYAPFSDEGKIPAEDFLQQLSKTAVVFGGKIPETLAGWLEKRDFSYYDYLKREELAVFNAEATAEGTIQLLMEELPVTIKGMSLLIIGSGRISKVLRRQLTGLGAAVTATARKASDLAWIELDGCTPLPFSNLTEAIANYPVIVNTVPEQILGENLLKKIQKEALLIDLASPPGGVDLQASATVGIRTIQARSLPGKVAPITAGDIIYRTVCNIQKEREESKNG